MQRLAMILALTMIVTPAVAQQQQITPSQMALQIDNAIGQMATALEQSQAQIKALQEQIKNLQDKSSKPAESKK